LSYFGIRAAPLAEIYLDQLPRSDAAPELLNE
jgi:hypothetical protein